MSDWDKFQALIAGAGTYSFETFITKAKGRMFDIDGGLDISVEATDDPSQYKDAEDKIVSHPVKDTAIRRLLRSLIKQGRVAVKKKAIGNKMAYYVYTDQQLAERGIVEDNEELREFMNARAKPQDSSEFIPIEE